MGHAFQYPRQVVALTEMSHPRGGERMDTICEIGFNAGHSAAILASANNATLHDFDLLIQEWSSAAVSAFKRLHPGRLHAHKGDSACMVPLVLERVRRRLGGGAPCDRFFVDGWHEEPSVSSDLMHAVVFTRTGGLIMADDATHRFPDIRPAWEQLVRRGYVTDATCHRHHFGGEVGLKGYCVGQRTDKPAPTAELGGGAPSSGSSVPFKWSQIRRLRAAVEPTRAAEESEGFCAATSESDVNADCDEADKGSFKIEDKDEVDLFCNATALAARCAARCARCARCRFVSYSSSWRDCSWFHSCPRSKPAGMSTSYFAELSSTFRTLPVSPRLKAALDAVGTDGPDQRPITPYGL